MDKRKVGRPKVTEEEHTRAITITLAPGTVELIDNAAENAKVSRSKMIEILCRAGFKASEEKINGGII